MPDPILDSLQDALRETHTIERELAGGGMARVFVATERALGRTVVVKTVLGDALVSDAAARFRREILTAAQLQHPNVVPVLGAGDAAGRPFFTMPYVEGASLRERLALGPVPLDDAVPILRDVARALAAAHARGIVHRDIKPGNILLAEGAAVVTDFGVAKARSAIATDAGDDATLTGVGVSIGTPAYMAPEQGAADPSLDHRADLYAWGVVAYELLAGERPFAELSGPLLVAAHMATAPTPLSEVAPHVPTHIAALVMQCLAKEPARRPQSANALLAVLERPASPAAAAGGAGSAATSGVAARQATAHATDDARTPRPSRSTLAFLVVAAAVAVVLAGWWTASRAGPTRNADTIAVAPFRVGGAAPDVRYLREGIGDLMVPQLRALPGVDAASMNAVLGRWRRAAESADADLEDGAAADVAAGAGASLLVLGDVVGTQSRLTLNARLIRTDDRTAIAATQVEGPADSVPALVTRLVTSLLATSDGATRERLRSVLSQEPSALTPFLRGERFYRRGRYAEASRAFGEAFDADTTFALAALRRHLSDGWRFLDRPPADARWLDRAWANRARLSGEDSLILIATAGETYPQAMPMPRRLRSLQALADRSQSAEVWFAYGDALFHFGPKADAPDPFGRSLAAFQRAEALDSSFAPALEHQSQLFFMAGDPAGARRAAERRAAMDSAGVNLLLDEAMLSFVLGDDAERRAALDRVSAAAPPMLLYVADIMTGAVADISIADTALARYEQLMPGTPPPEFDRRRRGYLWNVGRPLAAAARPAADDDTLAHVEIVLAGLMGDADPAAARRSAARLAERLPAAADSAPTDGHAAWAHFALAERALNVGDTAEVEQRLSAIERIVERTEPAPAAARARLFAAVLDAQLAVARRAPAPATAWSGSTACS